MDLFIKDRIERKKLIKFKVPNGYYRIKKIKNLPSGRKDMSELAERWELLGHWITKF